MRFFKGQILILLISFFILFVGVACARDVDALPAHLSGRMVFLANVGGNWDIFLWEPGKGTPVQLTNTPWDEKYPCISPSGKSLAYTTTEGRLFLMDLGTCETTPLNPDEYPGKWEHPSFSPDGKKLICSYFIPAEQDKAVLAMIDLKTCEVNFIFPQYGPQFSPAWSPANSRIAYGYTHCSSACGGIIQEIWVADVSRKTSRQLAMTGSHCLGPAWSQDGKKIAFSANMSGNFDIWTVDMASKRLTQLTRNPALDESPAFGPDGNYLAFISTRSGKRSIWIKNLQAEEVIEIYPFEKERTECKDLDWR